MFFALNNLIRSNAILQHNSTFDFKKTWLTKHSSEYSK